MTPLMSICIPTYNRGEFLKRSIESMVNDYAFMNSYDIEIVVSDNASTDNTQEVCEFFASRFPERFIYHRQKENLGYSGNIATLPKLAHGQFLKFQNDHFVVLPGVLDRVVKLVKEYENERPLICFGNGFIRHYPQDIYRCTTGDSFLDHVSYWTTWLGGFCYWRDDYSIVAKMQNVYADTLIPQTAILWELFCKKRVCIFDNNQLYDGKEELPPKGGFNVAQVFSQNYFGILKKYLLEGIISKGAYEIEKRRMFKGAIYGMYFDFNHRRRYHKGKYFAYTKEYHKNLYYWIGFLHWPFYKLIACLPESLRKYPLRMYYLWRKTMKIGC